MKKILILIPLFLLFVLFFFFTNNAYAQSTCELTISPSEVSPKYKGEIIIVSSGNCFRTGTKYSVIVSPKNKKMFFDSREVGSNFQQDIKTENLRELKAKINLNTTPIYASAELYKGSGNLGTWNVFVCLGELRYCDDNDFDNRAATGTITVAKEPPIPTPTPAPNLPLVLYENQSACKFQFKEKVSITVDNIIPDTEYSWWWEDDGKLWPAGKISPSSDFEAIDLNPPLVVNIPATETDKVRTRKFCIDLATMAKTRSCFQNGIKLEFSAFSPDDSACTEENSGVLPTPTPKTPLSPCSQWANLNGTPFPTSTTEDQLTDIEDKKCIAINTAIGNISTEPQGFVKFIFSLVLGLAGGIALIIIMISGYRFMASQGDPEKVGEARQQLTSAIVGLLFIIFSFVILEVIGVDLLKIPGFNP